MLPERSAAILASLALALLPWEVHGPLFTIGPLGMTLPEIGIAVTVAAFIAKRRWPLSRAATIPATVFIGALALSALLAPSHNANSIKFAARMLAGFLFGAAVCDAAGNRRGTRIITAGIVASCVLPAAAGIIEWLDPAAIGLVPFKVGDLTRSRSVFPYPTVHAGYLEAALPFAAFAPAGLLWCFVSAAGLFLSLTRTSVAIALLMAVVIGLRGLRMSNRRTILAGASIPLAFVLLIIAVPAARRGLGSHDLGRWYSARIELIDASVSHHTDDVYRLRLRVHNTSLARWNHEGRARFYLSYWTVPEACGGVRPITSALPAGVEPGGSADVTTYVHLPGGCSEVRIAMDVFSENVTPFYIHGSPRLGLRFSRDSGTWGLAEEPVDQAAIPADAGGAVKPLPSRRDLWGAAIRLWWEHPVLGIGPDNFRLRHAEVLSEHRTSDKVFANNLYLELLCGGGPLALAAFLWMIVAVGRRVVTTHVIRDDLAFAAALSLAGFCLHGFLDCMLLFTPIYAIFWTAYGLASTCYDERGQVKSNREQ